MTSREPTDREPAAPRKQSKTGFLQRHPGLGDQLENHRLAFQATLDLVAWIIGLYVAMVLRYDFNLAPPEWGFFSWGSFLVAALVATSLHLVTALVGGLYLGRYRYGTFDEMAHLLRSVAVASVLLAVSNRMLHQQLVPASVVFIGGTFALVVMTGSRYTWRLVLDNSLRPDADKAERALVFGAGEGGVQVIMAMLHNPASPYIPVGLLDDDSGKRNLTVMGVPVVGTREVMGAEAARLGATKLVIAIPSASAHLLRDLTDLALGHGLSVSALPPLSELFGSNISLGAIRPVTESDLLGRHEIDTDVDAIAGYLTGKRVLVTGAGGSIGSELCRQVARFAPAELVMLDRDESALHGVQMLIEGRALLDSRNLVVADIRDSARIAQVFDEHRPEVVFHAAALKHLPLLEMHPAEGVKTNIVGTANVLAACVAHDVERFVNISTDKAADPISVLGFTKRLAERLTADTARQQTGTYLSVRFGNVLGTRGSVLTAFYAQVDAGGPITVTDPDVTRFFMTVEEAVQLVIQAGAVGTDGEVLVLDMGEPVRIADIARRLAAQAPRHIDIVYTGLRRGEKLHEALLGRNERDVRPAHPLISHVRAPVLDLGEILEAVQGLDGDDLVIELQALCHRGLPAADDEAAEADRNGSPVDRSGPTEG